MDTPRRVLVIDDNETNRRVAQLQLERQGVVVALAANGPQALERLAAEPFDLVFLDGMMPGMDGPAVAREIRRRELAADTSPIPIVALTASVMPEDRQRMIEAGMDDHLGKPVSKDELAEILDRWLRVAPPRTARIPAVPEGGAPGTAGWLGGAPRSAGTGGASPVLDGATFDRLSDLGDATFVERIVRLFLADAAERIAQVDEALDTGNVVQLRRALHALEGICGNIGALALDRRARDLHELVRDRERLGDEVFAGRLTPTGLESLLEETRARLRERLTVMARR